VTRAGSRFALLRARVNTPPASPAVEEWDLLIYWSVVEPYPSEKYEFVSWDDYSQYMESHKIHVPNHQPESLCRTQQSCTKRDFAK
jgi:hypothetical protein